MLADARVFFVAQDILCHFICFPIFLVTVIFVWTTYGKKRAWWHWLIRTIMAVSGTILIDYAVSGQYYKAFIDTHQHTVNVYLYMGYSYAWVVACAGVIGAVLSMISWAIPVYKYAKTSYESHPVPVPEGNNLQLLKVLAFAALAVAVLLNHAQVKQIFYEAPCLLLAVPLIVYLSIVGGFTKDPEVLTYKRLGKKKRRNGWIIH